MKQFEMTEPRSSVEGVAKHLEVAQDSIYRWIGGQGLPAHKVELSEADEWLRAGDAEGGGKPASRKFPKTKRRRS